MRSSLHRMTVPQSKFLDKAVIASDAKQSPGPVRYSREIASSLCSSQ
jgi:hypothetical protein